MVDPVGLSGAGGANGPQQIQPKAPASPDARQQTESFRELLLENLRQVNELQQDATTAIEDLQAGRRNDLETVLMATAKADTAFNMLLAVRSKMMDAYAELSSIRV